MVEIVPQLRVRIILSPDNESWIIEKMARRLADHAAKYGISVDVGAGPRADADINHWMSYAFAADPAVGRSTMTITHLDDPLKIKAVSSLLKRKIDLGICLSSDHRQFLIEQGVPGDRLTYVLPAHDAAVVPRRITIGLTTRVYRDGRKREAMLLKLAAAMRLDIFRFDIFGAGWEDIIPELVRSGAEVYYNPGSDDYVTDYQEILQKIPFFDYYLYLGRDEGSLGTLDALAAGVRTIVTPQGFHCDLQGGITHPIWTQDDLEEAFRTIVDDRALRTHAVAGLTWSAYANDHCRIWRALVEGTPTDNIALSTHAKSPVKGKREAAWRFKLRYLSPRRARSAVSRLPILKPLRAWLLRRHRP